jgi:hypothetical protein
VFHRARRRAGAGRAPGPDEHTVRIRRLVVESVLTNPLAAVAEPATIRRLKSGDDVTFDELGLDSLARLTLATELDAHGFAISEVDVNESVSIDGLTQRLMDLR